MLSPVTGFVIGLVALVTGLVIGFVIGLIEPKLGLAPEGEFGLEPEGLGEFPQEGALGLEPEPGEGLVTLPIKLGLLPSDGLGLL